MSAIFTTIHGSHLYGLAHANSDRDTFTVVTDDHDFGDQPTRQQVTGFGDQRTDDLTFRLTEFIKRAHNGSHQPLEALFSPLKEWNPEQIHWAPWLASIRITSPDAFHAYERTIRKFAFGDFKRRRHAVRLSGNLIALRGLGWFSPVMEWQDAEWATELANTLSGNALLDELDIPRSDNYAENITNEGERK